MFRTVYESPEAKTQLFWFCHAGASSASLFRGGRQLSEPVSLHVAALPGREERYAEGTSQPLDAVVDQLESELLKTIHQRFAFIGHSFGSLLSYLLAKRLVSRGMAPAAMTVMTLTSPNKIESLPRAAGLNDTQFLDYLANRFDGVPDALRRNPEALNLFLPIVRYDLRLLESYQHTSTEPLPLPITAVGGTGDRAVSQADLAGWNAFTLDRFSLRMVPGGHFFPVDQVKTIVDLTLRTMPAQDRL